MVQHATSLPPLPFYVDEMRDRMFVFSEPMLFNSQQWADYYPHMTNIWTRTKVIRVETHGLDVELWGCRLANKRIRDTDDTDDREKLDAPVKKRHKARNLEGSELCNMGIRRVYCLKHADTDEAHKNGLNACRCTPEWIHVQRTEKSIANDHKHSHTLEVMDRFRRSHALLYFAGYKVDEGNYVASVVLAWIKAKYGKITKQLNYLVASDISNASRHWRKKHPNMETNERILEDDPEAENRKQCFDMLATTSSDGLRNALEELFRQVPGAIAVAKPILEAAQETPSIRPEEPAKVLEGIDIVIPAPGLPWNMSWDREKGLVDGLAKTAAKSGGLFQTGATPFAVPQPTDGGREIVFRFADGYRSTGQNTSAEKAQTLLQGAADPLLPPAPAHLPHPPQYLHGSNQAHS